MWKLKSRRVNRLVHLDHRGELCQTKTKHWKWIQSMSFYLFLFIILLTLLFFSYPSYLELKDLEKKKAQLQIQEKKTLENKGDALLELESLRHSPNYLEAVIRDRLNLYREGEIIIRTETVKQNK